MRHRLLTPTHLILALLSSTDPYHLIPASHGAPPIVALAGTRNWRDVLDDVDIRPCPWPVPGGGRVHCGIAQRTQRLWDEEEAFRRFCTAPHPQPLVLTGWSLGGGVCVALAARLRAEGVPVAAVHTFGAPRVGDARFRAWYEREGPPTTRYVTPRDPVPSVPRHYVHVGGQVEVPCRKRRWLQHHDLRAYLRGAHMLQRRAGRPKEEAAKDQSRDDDDEYDDDNATSAREEAAHGDVVGFQGGSEPAS